MWLWVLFFCRQLRLLCVRETKTVNQQEPISNQLPRWIIKPQQVLAAYSPRKVYLKKLAVHYILLRSILPGGETGTVCWLKAGLIADTRKHTKIFKSFYIYYIITNFFSILLTYLGCQVYITQYKIAHTANHFFLLLNLSPCAGEGSETPLYFM